MKSSWIVMIVCLLFLPNLVTAEEYPNWTGYPPMYMINDVIEYHGDVYCATTGGLFRYDPETQEYTLYYKNHGLVSNDVLCVGATSDAIYVGFSEDGLWRLDPESGTFTRLLFPEYHVKTFANPDGIALYDIFAKSDSILYIGHENGIDMLNLATSELRTYSNLGPDISENTIVTSVNVFGERIWAGTTLGLAVGSENDPNLEFPENWKNYKYVIHSTYDIIYGVTSVMPVDSSYKEIYVGTNQGGVFSFDASLDRIIPIASPKDPINDLREALGEYWAASDSGLFAKKVKTWIRHDATYLNLTALYAGENGRLWVGTKYDGLQCYTSEGYIAIPPPSEMKNMTFYDIEIDPNGVLWTVTTYRDSNLRSTFQRLDGDVWAAYYLDDWIMTNRAVSALADSRGNIWTTLWGTDLSGAYVIRDDGTPFKTDDEILPVDSTKDILSPTMARWYVVCSDIAEDKHGNVWIANYQVDPPLHGIEPIPSSGAVVFDGFPVNRYERYSPANDDLPTAIIFKICTDDDGWVWLGTYDRGVIGVYVGEDPFDKSDTEVYTLSIQQGLHDSEIGAVAVDLDGFVWVGTNAGLNRIEKAADHTLTVENMNESLDDADREVKCIEIDRFNNKWIGTSGGLLKVNSENEPVELFTIGNSGLFSDTILSLKYDDQNDVLWVGTAAGLNRFDIFGEEITETDPGVRVYPNPFEIWGYDSRVVFPNLKGGSALKIFSFSGDSVNSLTAETDTGDSGSSAVWDGRNFEGKYIGTGVYFFTGEDSHGRSFRDKMVVIRR